VIASWKLLLLIPYSYKGCDDYNRAYYNGFLDGYESAGNARETCERFTDF
jgi:hypothetical protein